MLGLFGSIISVIQAAALESGSLHSLQTDTASLIALLLFALLLFTMYTLTAHFLKRADATLFNISLLTSDVWAVLFRYLYQGSRVNWLYGLAFLLMALGLGLYHCGAPDVNDPNALAFKRLATTTNSDGLDSDDNSNSNGHQSLADDPNKKEEEEVMDYQEGEEESMKLVEERGVSNGHQTDVRPTLK